MVIGENKKRERIPKEICERRGKSVSSRLCRVLENELKLLCGCGVALAGLRLAGWRQAYSEAQLS